MRMAAPSSAQACSGRARSCGAGGDPAASADAATAGGLDGVWCGVWCEGAASLYGRRVGGNPAARLLAALLRKSWNGLSTRSL